MPGNPAMACTGRGTLAPNPTLNIKHPAAHRERHDARAGGRREGLGDAEDAAAAAAQLLPLIAAKAAIHALRHVARQLDVLLLVLACTDMLGPCRLKACMTDDNASQSCVESSWYCLRKVAGHSTGQLVECWAAYTSTATHAGDPAPASCGAMCWNTASQQAGLHPQAPGLPGTAGCQRP